MPDPRQCPSLLRGWKAIEDFLGLTRKTVLLHAYPIRRIAGGRMSVWAFRDELERHARLGSLGERQPGNEPCAMPHQPCEPRLRLI